MTFTRGLGRACLRETVLGMAGAAVVAVLAGCGSPRAGAGGEGPSLPAPVTDRPADPPPTSTTALPSAVPPTCGPLGFVLTVGPVDGASGLRVMSVLLRNCGVRPLTLHGYPAMRVLDADRRLLPVAVLDGITKVTLIPEYDVPPRPVTVRPGGSAMAVVAWRNTVTDPNVVATRAPYLQVAPAAGQPAQLLVPDGGLDVGNTGRIAVSPWLPDDTPTPAGLPTTASPGPPTTVPPPATPPATRAFLADVATFLGIP
jgi:Protein of unknown function (DUF4232)